MIAEAEALMEAENQLEQAEMEDDTRTGGFIDCNFKNKNGPLNNLELFKQLVHPKFCSDVNSFLVSLLQTYLCIIHICNPCCRNQTRLCTRANRVCDILFEYTVSHL